MELKILGLKINCGCDKRRVAMLNWFNKKPLSVREKFRGKSFRFMGWIYTVGQDGTITSEMKVSDKENVKKQGYGSK